MPLHQTWSRLTTVTALLISGSLFSQSTFTKIPFVGNVVDLQTYQVGDSLLLSIVDNNFGKQARSYWVAPDGKVTKCDLQLTDEKDKLAFSIIRFRGDYFTYFFKRKKEVPTLKIVKNGDLKTAKEIELNGKLLSTSSSSFVSILTFNSSEKSIDLVKIIGDSITTLKTTKLPDDIQSFQSNYVGFVDQDRLTTPYDATARLKLYNYQGHQFLTLDEPYYVWLQKSKAQPRTLIIDLDSDSSTKEATTVADTTKKDFRSFLYHDQLYRVSNTKQGLELKVFDMSGNLVVEKRILQAAELENQSVTLRFGREKKISNDDNLSRMIKISNLTDPFLIVEESTNSHDPILTWGSFVNENGPLLTNLANPVGLAISVVGTAIRLSMDPPGIARYFYLNQSSETIEILNESGTVRERIDRHELAKQKKKVRFSIKAYTTFENEVLGVYQYEGGSIIELVKFGRLR